MIGYFKRKQSHIYEGGTHLRISLQAFIEETEKQQFIKKTAEVGQQKTKNKKIRK